MLITPKLSTFFFIENTTYDIILTRIGSEVMNNYYQMSEKETLKKLKTTKEGLTTKEAVKRIKLYGKNSLPKSKQKSYIQVFFSEFKNPICYILLITLTLSFIIGEYVDAIFILFVVLIDALLGSVQEYKSSKSAEALKKIVKVEAKVLRDNKEVIIESSDLTIGDIVYLESGNIVPADLRLLVVNSLEVDESILTGESIPREKHTKKITKEVTINDRTNMCYLGTNITRGRAIGIVTSISKDTEIGSIAKEVLNSSRTLTPLQIRMNKFTKDLSLIAAVLAIIVTFILYIKGYTAKEIFFLVIALSVSAIPEGLPVVITLALSISSDKMAKKNVIVKKLNAVEALGSTTLIASDKTGTLTLNEQTVKKIVLPNNDTYIVTGEGYNGIGKIEGKNLNKVKNIIKEGLYNNEATLSLQNDEWVSFGDSMDIALLSLGYKYGLENTDLRTNVIDRIPYESDNGYSVAFYKEQDDMYITIKGDLEKVLKFTKKTTNKEKIRKQNELLASDGYRVLAFASAKITSFKQKDIYKESDIPILKFSGLVAFLDPIRPDAKEAVEKCKSAGIKVVMITGDHPLTAYKIARALGICSNETELSTGEELSKFLKKDQSTFDEYIKTKKVYSRVTPIQKLEIVSSYKRLGEFVTVTGDGVNDSPALKEANTGVAMGSGTDIAKETSSLIITDDKFSSIVKGVEEGRGAYDNIRKVTYMLLSCGVSEVVFYLFSILLDYSVPLTAIQLLWLNLVTDGIQDVALAFEQTDKDVLKRKPRSTKENLFDRLLKNEILLLGLTMGIVVFGVWIYLIDVLKLPTPVARSYILLLMVFMQNIQCFNCRSETKSLFSIPLKNNKKLVLSISIVLFIQFVVVENSVLSHLLETETIPLLHVLYLFLTSLPIIIVSEIMKYFERDKIRRGKS